MGAGSSLVKPGKRRGCGCICGGRQQFRTACRQVTILNERVIEAQNRIDRSNAVDRHSFRYCLRLRLIVLEGVRNVYYEYATRCAASLDDLYLDLMESSYYRTADSDDDAYDTDVSMTY